MFTGSGLSDLHVYGLPIGFKRPIDVVLWPPMMLAVPDANIIWPPCRLHKQHEAMISDGNILQPRLPLPRVPGMFL